MENTNRKIATKVRAEEALPDATDKRLSNISFPETVVAPENNYCALMGGFPSSSTFNPLI